MNRFAYLLLLPLFALLGVVEIYPLILTVELSVTNYGQGGAFVGASNYIRIFSDPAFWGSLSTSLLYSTGSTIVSLILGIMLAFLLTQVRRRKGTFESIFLMPLAAAPIVAGVVWAPTALWDDVNNFWHYILRQPFFDVTQYYLFLPIMILSDAWQWAPMMMLVSLSVIAGVPKQVYEAAALSGASEWKVFRSVALPAILRSPVIHFMVIIRFIDAMRSFEIPFAWAAWISTPQPGSPVDTLSLFLFKLLLAPTSSIPIPYISAVALVLLTVTLTGATVLFRLMRGLGKI